jgi:hypothetical protein
MSVTKPRQLQAPIRHSKKKSFYSHIEPYLFLFQSERGNPAGD